MDLKVSVFLSFIYLEKEVLFCNNFSVGGLGKGFLVKLIFKVLKDEFLLYNGVNFILNLFYSRDITS